MDINAWKKRKKELHWTHDDLARESGVSRRTIARIFSGNPDSPSPTLNTVEAIEKALGIENPTLEWTEEDKALGVGNHPTYLSERERKWMELGSEVLRIKGEAYYDMLEQMIEAVIKIK